MATQVILLEKVGSLGDMGEVVSVKPGYARNYLLPQKKALRATQENIAYFESQKNQLQAENEKKKKQAQKQAKKFEGLTVALIRQASESGQLYGSVAARDIAEEASKAAEESLSRSAVQLNQNFKMIGLFPVEIQLHPEISVTVMVNIARSQEEAEIQARTGQAVITAALEDVLEEGALAAEKERKAAEAESGEEEAKGGNEETNT